MGEKYLDLIEELILIDSSNYLLATFLDVIILRLGTEMRGVMRLLLSDIVVLHLF